MKPVYQDIFTPPHGNCLQACIASLFELPLDAVPNFMDAPDNEWWDRYCNWTLDNFGVYPVGVDAIELPDFVPAGWHLIQGKSPRGEYDHVMVGHNGSVKHDPYPGGCGVKRVKFYHVFVAIDPLGK